jgi:hypothetical protein
MNEMLLFLSMMFHSFAMRLGSTVPGPDYTKMVHLLPAAAALQQYLDDAFESDPFPDWRSACCASRHLSCFSCFETAIINLTNLRNYLFDQI